MSQYRCPLGSMLPVPMDAERIKTEAWENDGILVVNMADGRLTWVEQQQLKQIGEKLYGTSRSR